MRLLRPYSFLDVPCWSMKSRLGQVSRTEPRWAAPWGTIIRAGATALIVSLNEAHAHAR